MVRRACSEGGRGTNVEDMADYLEVGLKCVSD